VKAAIFQGVQDVSIGDVDEPQISPDGILVNVRACGICGTDVHGFASGLLLEPGQIMGHEFAGEVTAVGEKVTGIAVGDRVAAMPLVPCWSCPQCVAGRVELCARAFNPGIGFGLPGALAERVHVPWVKAGRTVFTLPAELDYEAGALLEPLAVAVHAAERAPTSASDVVVIFGLGPIGQLIGRVLLGGGVERVVGVERSATRRACAERAGIETVDGSPGIAESVATILGETPVDVVFEAAGPPSFPNEAVGLVRKGGTVVIVSTYEAPALIDVAAFAVTQTTVASSSAYRSEDYRRAIALVRDGLVAPADIVTARESIANLPSVLASLVRPSEDIKVLINL
jgi:2-desacetyl-2-hydroxyethyl bacteriochlorophyllide A dehydrogenase